ncbi:PAS domain S-box-containing protein/diguanylate cyclase (GGDEF) domain-containing protein [Andreprevotia lacus DSM 23236]|uniref:PAS domain S-box-containing protein/diguanylate cyclase (GGDEF) domain-containing protein n=1 Tax=Andreprevotia lacus DSM 23236 TaxID=1121001 RepID=A0A1W1WYE0_9NEIS|nr:PAS domain S-box-containing protein/diguanylate cyclase (GGDEF) domain-containing protein [Andreprevotia lacus DSM 23236]
MFSHLPSRFQIFYQANRLAWRLVAAVVGVSFIVTLSLTAFLVRQEYQRSLTQISTDLDTLARSVTPQLGANLWLVNTEAVRTQLNSLLQTKAVNWVELVEPDGSRYSVGTVSGDPKNAISKTYTVNYMHPLTGKAVRLGELRLVNTLDGLESQLYTQVTRMLLLLGSGMAASALCFLWLYHRLIARHLSHIAEYTRSFNYERLSAPLDLARGDSGQDELQVLTDAFNTMRLNLQKGIDEKDVAQRELFQEKELAEVTLISVADAIVTTTAAGHVKLLNPAAEKLIGWTFAEAKGLPIGEVVITQSDAEGPRLTRLLQAAQTAGKRQQREKATLISRGGERFMVEIAIAPISDWDGNRIGYVVALHDISAAEALTARLAYQATHDELTGLTNRRGFMSALVQANDAVKLTGARRLLMQIDLDQFKLVNDTCGHQAGDELLRQLARMLIDMLPDNALVGRLGGDEFGVLLADLDEAEAQVVAMQLLVALEQYRFVWQDRPFTVTGSLGLVSMDQDCASPQEAMSRADVACFAAKDAGRNRFAWYRGGEEDLQGRHNELQLLATLRQAAETNRFKLHYQPIVPTLGPHQVPHYEVLLRLEDEQGRLISPGAFIPAAERYDMMATIDRWVVSHVLDELSQRQARGEVLPELSINLSGKSLNRQTLAFVLEQLEEKPLPSDRICFEITETSAIANIKESALFIEALRARGCRFALDDFGSGFSSFTYLKSLPVDYLKIDGSLVRDVAEDDVSRQMVLAVNRIAHAMGRKTIAEYVENQAIVTVLQEIGVDYLQGYHIGRPEPAIRETQQVWAGNEFELRGD